MESKKIRVLLVDDDKDDAFLTHRALSQITDPGYEVEFATCMSEAIEKANTNESSLVLLDLGLPGSFGIETLQFFRQGCDHDLPIIVLTGLADEKTALESLDAGAQDYLVKDSVNPSTLSRSIRHSLQRHELRSELESANELLKDKNERLSQLCETAQQFVDNVSHEFRTPLTVIREFTSIIRDGLDGPVTERQIEHLERVLYRTDDLALMVDDMLDISKFEAGLLAVWRQPCQAADLLNKVGLILKDRAASKSIDLQIKVDPDLPTLFCDTEKASRVIINLMVNALKFTQNSGSITVWAKLNEEKTDVIIGVSDTGPGISPENLSAIFDRFQQVGDNIRNSTKGFGLGLNIAKELVNLNLGKMNVESDFGHGSTFSFTLPCFDVMHLYDRYEHLLVNANDSSKNVSLLQVTPKPAGVKAAIPTIDEFIQREVRGRDFVALSANNSWIIVAQCPEQEVDSLISRLEKSWQEFSSNCPGKSLPGISAKSIGSWHLPDKSKELRTVFQEMVFTDEPEVRGKVLIVDDDPEVNLCLGLRLQAAGFEVLSAADGVEGLKAIDMHNPDAVVLDVRMPHKDGMEVLEEMRSNTHTKNLPVVMLSASVRDQHLALDAGANFFVPKPYQASAVLSALETSMIMNGESNS